MTPVGVFFIYPNEDKLGFVNSANLSLWQIAAIDNPTRKMKASDVNMNIPPLDAKKLTTSASEKSQKSSA